MSNVNESFQASVNKEMFLQLEEKDAEIERLKAIICEFRNALKDGPKVADSRSEVRNKFKRDVALIESTREYEK